MNTIEWQRGLTFQYVEGCLLKSALEKHEYNIKEVAKALGVSRSTVYKKVTEYFGVSVMDLKCAKRAGDLNPFSISKVIIA